MILIWVFSFGLQEVSELRLVYETAVKHAVHAPHADINCRLVNEPEDFPECIEWFFICLKFFVTECYKKICNTLLTNFFLIEIGVRESSISGTHINFNHSFM
jgi:hypothetical protein